MQPNYYMNEMHFPNGFGVSIISTPTSYGGRSGLFEVALVKHFPEKDSWDLVYNDEFPDVIGFQSFVDVGYLIQSVENYPPDQKYSHDIITTLIDGTTTKFSVPDDFVHYEHRWNKSNEANPDTWNQYKKIVKKIFSKSKVSLVNDRGEKSTKPLMEKDVIAFNGEKSCQPFILNRFATPEKARIVTSRFDYDKVVVACLYAAKDLSIISEFSSDGNEDDLFEGKELWLKAKLE